ncbi:MAG TPA: transcription elongation factor GreA [Candidatus Dormibacteraeota bacterium]|nr:transcription elongation factor GreA [Candidatus Dormibacteraeota bacterium]
MQNTTNKRDFYLTKEGVEKLKEELHDLTHNQRQAVARELKEAKEYGDLSENASYDAAKDHQSFVEGRIAEIEHILKNAVIIETPKTNGAVGIGSTVHIEVEGGVQKFTIVGTHEANPEEGKISNESPIGQALLGKKKGDEIAVEVPSGTMTYKVKHIE